MINNEDSQPLFFSDISSHYENKYHKFLKCGMVFVALNTSAILIVSSILFYQINMIYNDVTSSNVTNTFSQIEKIINNACLAYPEICYHEFNN